MTTAVVLGAGMVGSVIAADLARDDRFSVAIADRDAHALERASKRAEGRIRCLEADLADPKSIQRLVAEADIVLGALASHLGFRALRAVIEAGKDYCDISFMPEDALELDSLARERGVTAVVDCGVAPGMSNLLAGYGTAQLDEAASIHIYVGGVPRARHWPFDYKAGFAPADVIEEYTRPARFVVNGEIVTREALSEPELLEFTGVGTLEAFNTDGLRSLMTTLNVSNMIEKTMRYPGHAELMRVLRAIGLFSPESIEVKGKSVRPLDVMSQLLFPMWEYEPGEADITVMRVIVKGMKNGKSKQYHWDLHDEYDALAQTTSMARTTAFPCAIVARMIADGSIQQPGVVPPELLTHDRAVVETILDELAQRGVTFIAREE